MLHILFVAVVIALMCAGPVGWAILIVVVIPTAIVVKVLGWSGERILRSVDRKFPRFAYARWWLAENTATLIAWVIGGVAVAFIVALLFS